MYEIDRYLNFILNRMEKDVERLENNQHINKRVKGVYIKAFKDEAEYLKSLTIPKNIKREVDKEYNRELKEYIRYNIENYIYIQQTTVSKNLNYYLKILSWYKISYLNVYNVYENLTNRYSEGRS